MKDPGRWTDGAASGASSDEGEARAAQLLREGLRAPELGEEALSRIEQEISLRLSRRRWPAWMKAALGAGVIGAGTLAFAAVQSFRAEKNETPVRHATSGPAPIVERSDRPPAPATPQTQAPRAEVLTPRAPQVPKPPAAPLKSHASPPKSRAADTNGALGREAALLQASLVALRDRKDPDAALDTLAEYDRAHPDGQLREEALRVRVEALEAKGRIDDAIDAITTARHAGTSDNVEWLLVQAELQLRAHRYEAALDGFTRARGSTGSGVTPHDARALAGSALCLRALGRGDDARTTAAAYLRAFPKGRHAAQMKVLARDQ